MRSAFALCVIAAACVNVLRPVLAQELEPDSVVRSIHQDTRGWYWFGTQSDGVYRSDGRDLTRFTEQDGLANNQVRSILEDPQGVVWFETAAGLSRYEDDSIRTYTARDYNSKDNWQLSREDLWFKGDRSTGVTMQEGSPGVYRFDVATLRYYAFPLEIAREDQDAYSVTGIHRGDGGRVWIATYSAVIGFDGEEFVVIDDESLGHTPETGCLHARCVFEDSKGRLWIGNNGIGVIMRDGDTTINFTQAQGVGRSDERGGSGIGVPAQGDAPAGEPSLNRVFAIGEDRDGNIWFGTREQGAWRFDGTSLRQFTARDGLQTKQVFAIHVDRNGDLLLGGQGVFRFDGTRFEKQF
ncbi:MAG: hypothetical protein H6810_09020 [Phycisphaeraceae bacterium]|nr:MAG: hypothetical protein H6810_09020 [Phycisphaeraceae bacterium]